MMNDRRTGTFVYETSEIRRTRMQLYGSTVYKLTEVYYKFHNELFLRYFIR